VTDEGLVTVTGVDPGTAASVTVQAEIPGETLPGTGTANGTSLQSAHDPVFEAAVRKPRGFEVRIRNFAANDAFTWAVDDVTPGGAHAELNQSTGLVTVTDVAPGTQATVTVTATQEGVFVPGRASKTGFALNAARTPQFGATTRTADGFTAQISNYSDQFDWTGTATQSGTVSISGSGRVTVTGVAPNTASVATITTRRDGFEDGTDTVSETSLKAARVPRFAGPVRTPDGFRVLITNYDTAFQWILSATRTSDTVEIDEDGLVTVTGVAPGTTSRLRVTTKRTGHAVGVAVVSRSSVAGPALTPEFGPVTRAAGGFTVQIQNRRAGFTWVARSTAGTASISGQVVRVTGLTPSQSAKLTVTTRRAGYTNGYASVSGTALAATPPDRTRARVPAAPRISQIRVLRKGKAAISYTPAADGGAPLLGATATCKPVKQGNLRTASATRGPLTVTQLKKGATYNCTVSVFNAVGASRASAVKRIRAK
jgi:hypothetical protein